MLSVCVCVRALLTPSPSGIDLPMKVLDMFGGGVPVVAVGFEAIGELVEDGVNGRVFEGDGLADVLEEVLGNEGTLETLREGVGTGKRWEENWEDVMGPVLAGLEGRERGTSSSPLVFGVVGIVALVASYLSK